jgi:hypothetical protein
MSSIGAAVQRLEINDQVLVLARLAHAQVGGPFAPRDVSGLLAQLALPAPTRISNAFTALALRGLLVRHGSALRSWQITPAGRERSVELVSQLDLASLAAEAAATGTAALGGTEHPTLPPEVAPPSLLPGLRRFLDEFPFETNVFGMTRFPNPDREGWESIDLALETARRSCHAHAMAFHLASDRAIEDSLWGNVNAHMWGCRYGIALFEDLSGDGINYNLTIEVGAMLIAGRRCLLLKDESIERMPTDLVGHIYKPIDLRDADSVSRAVHSWLAADLGLGPCPGC